MNVLAPKFQALLKPHGKRITSFTEQDIKNEPMLYSADPHFAWRNGGPLTKAVLSQYVMDPDANIIIDTRVHMLKPGWFPAIPGWHLDAIERGPDGQPDLSCDTVDGHVLCIIDAGTGSETEVLQNPPALPLTAPEGVNLWAEHDRLIEEASEPLFTRRLNSGVIDGMTPSASPRAAPATDHGWRFLFRATVGYPRAPHNEIRRQVNVYLNAINGGW